MVDIQYYMAITVTSFKSQINVKYAHDPVILTLRLVRNQWYFTTLIMDVYQ